jgi:hypothetical protein
MEWLSLEVVCLLEVLKTHTSCVAAMLTAKAPKTVLINVGEGLGINKWIKTTGHTLTFLTKKLVTCACGSRIILIFSASWTFGKRVALGAQLPVRLLFFFFCNKFFTTVSDVLRNYTTPSLIWEKHPGENRK